MGDAGHGVALAGLHGDALGVLVVGDSQAQRVLLESFLREQGYRTVSAGHGRSALTLIESAPERARDGAGNSARLSAGEVDLVIMDFAPGPERIEATRRIRAAFGERWVPIILLSGPQSAADVACSLEAGADDYLPKPVDLALLAARLRSFQRAGEAARMLARHRREAEVELELAMSVMERMVQRQPGLRDPALQWAVLPSGRFSGDTVAAVRTPSERLLVMLADASGHGLPAAISLLPMLQVFYGMGRKDFAVAELAREMNQRLREYAPVNLFLAAAIVAFDARRRSLEVWNGGMPAGLLLRGGEEIPTDRLASVHPPLGVLEDDRFRAECLQLQTEPGSRVVLFSDGLLEAADRLGEPFGSARLRQCLLGGSADPGPTALLNAIAAHLGGAPAHDDISLAIIDCG